MDLVIFSSAVVAAAPPILLGVLGETITEKAGVINLSLDGKLLLSAMTAFVVALKTGSVATGVVAAMIVGALVAGIVAVASLSLRQPQVATGFVLTLLCRDLAYVLGNPYAHVPGPQIPHITIPYIRHLPLAGPILFDHNLAVYLSLLAIPVIWFLIYHTRPGLILQGLGERPRAASARGVKVTRLRYAYVLIGGALVGAGGASYSLLVKPGWARPYGIEGTGWIILAIVIFGNWRPWRAFFGCLLFVALQTAATTMQSVLPNVPTQLFPTLPFPLMILTLLLVTLGNADWVNRLLGHLPPRLRRLIIRAVKAMQTSPPAALGKAMEE